MLSWDVFELFWIFFCNYHSISLIFTLFRVFSYWSDHLIYTASAGELHRLFRGTSPPKQPFSPRCMLYHIIYSISGEPRRLFRGINIRTVSFSPRILLFSYLYVISGEPPQAVSRHKYQNRQFFSAHLAIFILICYN